MTWHRHPHGSAQRRAARMWRDHETGEPVEPPQPDGRAAARRAARPGHADGRVGQRRNVMIRRRRRAAIARASRRRNRVTS